MRKRITVVCRHNQARSVVAAAALNRYFPEMDVSSAGIAAMEGQRIPQSILNLCENWGLEVGEVVSHSLQGAENHILSADYIIVAENEFISEVVSMGVSPARILSMQDPRFDHDLIPFDPIGKGNQVVSVELAKAIATSVQLIREKGDRSRANPVNVIFSENVEEFLENLAIGWEAVRKSNGILLVADFRAPNISAVTQNCEYALELKVNRVNRNIDLLGGERISELQLALSSRKRFAISGRFEVDRAEAFILSTQFAQLMANLTHDRHVLILTEPKSAGPCAYLAAANADLKAS